ncbi:anthranilate synthase component I family protein [uncultured Microbacterium sp.]|uniref:anthranilate synthase component I family protein n=1 Tax=uncultured Microbacterium sp. TaxID=191216 RepID=UPI0028DB796C|nr:anthranilate synthase component I family protein [uncultured Microbacterium sp.]
MPDRLRARLLDDWHDPAVLFRALEAQASDVFWLDAGPGAVDGWSFVGVGDIDALPASLPLAADVAPDDADDEDAERQGDLPPFRGGWVGWLDYESGAAAAGAPVAAPGDPRSWLRARRIAAYDHARQRVWLCATGDDLADWTAEVRAADARVARAPVAESAADARTPPSAVAPTPARPLVAQGRHEPAAYADLIEQCRALIRAGVAYQLCLTTRFTVPGIRDAAEAYLRLRAATPAHHGGFIRIGGRALLSASPEQFLRVEGGVIRTRPIKGTRPRGTTPAEDAALAAELAASPKERAENVMIVDLMRNDLSRVSVAGSISVDRLWAVESYPAVHQLVSSVSGTATPGATIGDLLAATFPAGSMTGAPKLSAMTRLHALEGGPRGVYAGCFGYVGDDGELDLAMVIRSILVEPDGTAVVGAGGGITWGSDARAEVDEVGVKARGPLAALGAVLPAGWGSDILN